MPSSSRNGAPSKYQYAIVPMLRRSSLSWQTPGLASRRQRCLTSSNDFIKLTARKIGPLKVSGSDSTSPRNLPRCWAAKLPSKASRIKAQLSRSRYPVKLPAQMRDLTGEPVESDFYDSTILLSSKYLPASYIFDSVLLHPSTRDSEG